MCCWTTFCVGLGQHAQGCFAMWGMLCYLRFLIHPGVKGNQCHGPVRTIEKLENPQKEVVGLSPKRCQVVDQLYLFEVYSIGGDPW